VRGSVERWHRPAIYLVPALGAVTLKDAKVEACDSAAVTGDIDLAITARDRTVLVLVDVARAADAA
jgi:hypothetical protein